MAHFLRMLTDKTVVSSEKQKEIEGWHRDVMARHHCDPTKQKLLPSIEKRVNEVAAQLSAECPHLQFHYEMYYRDVSGFAHSSAWGIMSRLPRSTSGPIEATADPSLGIQALMTNGEWFLRVLWAWNKVAKVLTEEQIQGWQKEWAEAHLGMGL